MVLNLKQSYSWGEAEHAHIRGVKGWVILAANFEKPLICATEEELLRQVRLLPYKTTMVKRDALW